MTRKDVLEVLAVVALKWPHSTLGDPREAADGWMHAIGDFGRSEIEAAIDRLGDREHAPTSGIVANEARLERQGTPAPFEEIGNAIQRAQRWLPYSPIGGYTPQDTARAVAVLQARGVHETVLRFVAAHGIGAVYRIPWGELNPNDLNQSADRRDMARAYRNNTIAAWQRDPRPGLALRRACETAGLDAAEVLAVAGGVRIALPTGGT